MDCPVDSAIEVRSSRFGRGLFAKQMIPAFSFLCKATGKILSFSETVQLAERESHCLQIDHDKYILCEPPFLYSNHSCTPNCALNEHLELISIKKIQKDEELVWDYSTSMYERHWTMQCKCGTKRCRKIINDFDLLPLDIQIDYLKRKMVLPFIVSRLKEELDAAAFRA
ncbi:MAG: SET domain-containing protein-lysine N-methyltransferase [Chitinophagaceae bacterium]|nr:SET domain-containing protein-lysine N-methyltransferase [Chitinophagaceae bacterium]